MPNSEKSENIESNEKNIEEAKVEKSHVYNEFIDIAREVNLI